VLDNSKSYYVFVFVIVMGLSTVTVEHDDDRCASNQFVCIRN